MRIQSVGCNSEIHSDIDATLDFRSTELPASTSTILLFLRSCCLAFLAPTRSKSFCQEEVNIRCRTASIADNTNADANISARPEQRQRSGDRCKRGSEQTMQSTGSEADNGVDATSGKLEMGPRRLLPAFSILLYFS